MMNECIPKPGYEATLVYIADITRKIFADLVILISPNQQKMGQLTSN